MFNDLLERAARLSGRGRLVMAGAGALAIVATGLFVLMIARDGCASREDVTARVGEVAAKLQQAAAQGKIKVERLADGVRRMNAAATSYEATKDHTAYCEALDELAGEFKLTD